MANIKFNIPFQAGNETKYIQEVISSGVFAGNGPFTRKCQAQLQSILGAPHVLLTTSCTAALEMSAILLDIAPGDEVIVPSYTFVSTASAFLRAGAVIKFCEIDPDTLTVDLKHVESLINSRTRAIAPIHYAVAAADMPALTELAAAHNLAIVEDAAQGLGAKLNGRAVGTWAPLSCLSFHETKNLHCGLGGALVVNDKSYFDRAEDVWERGTDRGKMFRGLVDKYSWVELGSSFYPSELQAAFLYAQLEAYELNLKIRRSLWNQYFEEFNALDRPFRIQKLHARTEHNGHAFVLIFPTRESGDSYRDFLKKHGIDSYIGYVPLHSSKMGLKLGYKRDSLPITEDVAYRVVRLPLHASMKSADISAVLEATSKWIKAQ